MIVPKNWLNYYVAIYLDMKRTYHNHNIKDYIDYHNIRYILHISISDYDYFCLIHPQLYEPTLSPVFNFLFITFELLN